MKKIFYWGPFIDNKIATVKAMYNSAKGINRFSKSYKALIVNNLGEWNFKINENNKEFFIGTKYNFINKLPKFGFIRSRFSYIIIFIITLISLKNILKKYKPDYFIAHLIVSAPLILFKLFNFETRLIIRISGKPNLIFLENLFGKIPQILSTKYFALPKRPKKI